MHASNIEKIPSFLTQFTGDNEYYGEGYTHLLVHPFFFNYPVIFCWNHYLVGNWMKRKQKIELILKSVF